MFGAAVAQYAGLSVGLPFARLGDALAYLLVLTRAPQAAVCMTICRC